MSKAPHADIRKNQCKVLGGLVQQVKDTNLPSDMRPMPAWRTKQQEAKLKSQGVNIPLAATSAAEYPTPALPEKPAAKSSSNKNANATTGEDGEAVKVPSYRSPFPADYYSFREIETALRKNGGTAASTSSSVSSLQAQAQAMEMAGAIPGFMPGATGVLGGGGGGMPVVLSPDGAPTAAPNAPRDGNAPIVAPRSGPGGGVYDQFGNPIFAKMPTYSGERQKVTVVPLVRIQLPSMMNSKESSNVEQAQ